MTGDEVARAVAQMAQERDDAVDLLRRMTEKLKWVTAHGVMEEARDFLADYDRHHGETVSV